MNLTDSHAHLDREEYDADRSDLFKRASSEGVGTILNIALGPEIEHFERAHRLVVSVEQPALYLAVGVHPHDAQKMTDGTLDVLRDYARKERVVAIGEIGLDYYYEHSPREVQRKRFSELLDLALELKLPVSIHSRDAFEDTFREIASRDIFTKVGGVMHCFTGSAAEAKQYLDIGAYISFSGIVTFKKATNVQEAAKYVPLERLLIETDSPFLSPEPNRGKRNEPAMVRRVAEVMAELRGIAVDEVATITSRNAATLFGWH